MDDTLGRTLISASSLDPDVRGHTQSKTEDARLVGTLLGRRALDKGIDQVSFDRGGYKYHGRVKALAEAAKEVGLKF
jgi:large subunit ribosomal protein L18